MVSAANAASLLLRRSPCEYNSPTTVFSRKEANPISRFTGPAASRWGGGRGGQRGPCPRPAGPRRPQHVRWVARLCPGGLPSPLAAPRFACLQLPLRGGRAAQAGSPRGLLPPCTPVRVRVSVALRCAVISGLRLGFKLFGWWDESAKLVYVFCLCGQIGLPRPLGAFLQGDRLGWNPLAWSRDPEEPSLCPFLHSSIVTYSKLSVKPWGTGLGLTAWGGCRWCFISSVCSQNLGNSPPKLALLNHLKGVTDIPSLGISPGESQVWIHACDTSVLGEDAERESAK